MAVGQGARVFACMMSVLRGAPPAARQWKASGWPHVGSIWGGGDKTALSPDPRSIFSSSLLVLYQVLSPASRGRIPLGRDGPGGIDGDDVVIKPFIKAAGGAALGKSGPEPSSFAVVFQPEMRTPWDASGEPHARPVIIPERSLTWMRSSGRPRRSRMQRQWECCSS